MENKFHFKRDQIIGRVIKHHSVEDNGLTTCYLICRYVSEDEEYEFEQRVSENVFNLVKDGEEIEILSLAQNTFTSMPTRAEDFPYN